MTPTLGQDREKVGEAVGCVWVCEAEFVSAVLMWQPVLCVCVCVYVCVFVCVLVRQQASGDD